MKLMSHIYVPQPANAFLVDLTAQDFDASYQLIHCMVLAASDDWRRHDEIR